MNSVPSYTAADLHDSARVLHLPRLRWLNPGWLCVFAALGLNLIGIIAIATTQPGYAAKQSVFLFIGLCAAIVAAVPRYRIIHHFSVILLIFVIILLIFVLIPLVPDFLVHPRNGARRWINLGITDFQPSELAKIAYIFALASYLRYRSNHRSFRGLLIPLILTFIPVTLILAEPDLGTALLFFPTFFAMMLAAGSRLKHIVLIVSLGLAVAPTMYPFLQPHQKDRIQAIIYQIKGDDRYINDIGYQGHKAMTLVGAGGITGTGASLARDLIQSNRLPEEHNDMIFAVIACRWGFIGTLIVWGLFALFALGGLLTAILCRDPFGRLVAVGFIAVMFTQMIINTGMTIGLLPITGMTLPFVSYGGSSLLTAWLMAGVLFNIALRRDRTMNRPPFEFTTEDDQ